MGSSQANPTNNRNLKTTNPSLMKSNRKLIKGKYPETFSDMCDLLNIHPPIINASQGNMTTICKKDKTSYKKLIQNSSHSNNPVFKLNVTKIKTLMKSFDYE